MTMWRPYLLAVLVACVTLGQRYSAQAQDIKYAQKISETSGGFGGLLDPADLFGTSLASIGDVNGDGIADLAVGAAHDDDGGNLQGAVWILFMSPDGTVLAEQKISETEGGFGGLLAQQDLFGSAVAELGDVDGDGVVDIAVGASEVGILPGEGSVWILFLRSDGTVSGERRITEGAGGFGGALDPLDNFGRSIARLGDLDGDGRSEIAVGASLDDDGGIDYGAIWVLSLQADGAIASETKISRTMGGFSGELDSFDYFGTSCAAIEDLDGNGVRDLAVGAFRDDDGGLDQGAVWILFMHEDGTVASEQKMSATMGGFWGPLDPSDWFGASVADLGDIDSDGTMELAVGAPGDDDGGLDTGAVWILSVLADGTVASHRKISGTNCFAGSLDASDRLGISVCALGDLDFDGIVDIGGGAYLDDDGGVDQGAAWVMFLGPDATAPVIACPPFVCVVDDKTGPPGEFVAFTVTAIDACDPTPSVICAPPSGSFFERGTTMVICTATDASGNQSVCTFPVVVMPTIRERRL